MSWRRKRKDKYRDNVLEHKTSFHRAPANLAQKFLALLSSPQQGHLSHFLDVLLPQLSPLYLLVRVPRSTQDPQKALT